MTSLCARGNWFLGGVAALLLGLPAVRAESVYLSVVAEATGPTVAAAPGKPLTYAAIEGGSIDAGDPVGGTDPVPAPLINAALSQALAGHGYAPAPAGASPALLLVYNWGEIRHDSFQLPSANHLKGNDRARLLLVARTADAERIERDLVSDRYFSLKVGAMTRTEIDRDTLQQARDELAFVVISADAPGALSERNPKPVWQVKLTTRAIGHPLNDSLVSLIKYGAPYFGRDEPRRIDLKRPLVTATLVPAAAGSVAPVLAGLDAAPVERLAKSEHALWSGNFPGD